MRADAHELPFESESLERIGELQAETRGKQQRLWLQLVLAIVLECSAVFFMGRLFFLAGYFAHRSLARRGPASFVRERLFRLGLPTLLFMLVIHPFVLLGLNPWHTPFGPAPAYYAKFISFDCF